MDRGNGFFRRWQPGLASAFLVALILAPAVQAAKKANEISQETLALHPEILDMRQRVDAEPESAWLQASLGNMYARMGWDDLAIESYLEALQLDESLYEAWTNLGTLYNRRGDLPQAEKAFRKAIALQPRAALAYYNLGTVLDRSDRYDEALAAYKTAITYAPDLLDPAINPQVVNNQHLTSIRLMSYLESSGSGALPLEEFTADVETMMEELESDEEPMASGEEEIEPPAAVVVPVAMAAGDPAPEPPPAALESPSGKPILGTLEADVKKESRRARRKRLKQEQAQPPLEPGTPAP